MKNDRDLLYCAQLFVFTFWHCRHCVSWPAVPAADLIKTALCPHKHTTVMRRAAENILWSGQFFYSRREVIKQETKTTRGWASEDDPRLWIFCSLWPPRHKIVNCVLGVGLRSVSCFGAAVSCLKLAVDFWTQQTFINRGRRCSKIYSAWVELKESLSENKIQSWWLTVGQLCQSRWLRPPLVRVFFPCHCCSCVDVVFLLLSVRHRPTLCVLVLYIKWDNFWCELATHKWNWVVH